MDTDVCVLQSAVGLRAEGSARLVELSGGGALSASCVIVASGVSYRQLDTPGFPELTGAGIPVGSFVGKVTDTPQTATSPSGSVDTGSFQLVDKSGSAVDTTGPVSGVSLGARTPGSDPLFNATSATNGGGDTGSVLISPFINPGTSSSVYYNHYSWLRTMEDLFDVAPVSKGLDGDGHLGYAAQPGLAPFGRDVFNNPGGHHGH